MNIYRAVQTAGERLDIPFPPAMHAQAGRAETLARQWALRLGLLPDASTRQQLDAARLGRLCGRCHPVGPLAGLRLVTDWTVWLAQHDDHCDQSALGRCPTATHGYHSQLLNQLHTRASRVTALNPSAAALLNLIARGHALGGEAWTQRFLQSFESYLSACQWEASNREQGRIPDEAEYVDRRIGTSGIGPSLVCGELAMGAHLPVAASAGYQNLISELCHLASQVTCWINDIYSLPRELQHDDVHNLVIILQHASGLSQEQALEAVVGRVHAALQEFLRQEQRLAALPDGERGRAGRTAHYYRCWMRGYWEWCKETGRYRLT